MNEQIRKELATETALRFSDVIYDKMLEELHDIVVEVTQERFGDLLNTESDEYYDLLIDIVSRVGVTAN